MVNENLAILDVLYPKSLARVRAQLKFFSQFEGNKRVQFVVKKNVFNFYNALAYWGGKISYAIEWNVATIF